MSDKFVRIGLLHPFSVAKRLAAEEDSNIEHRISKVEQTRPHHVQGRKVANLLRATLYPTAAKISSEARRRLAQGEKASDERIDDLVDQASSEISEADREYFREKGKLIHVLLGAIAGPDLLASMDLRYGSGLVVFSTDVRVLLNGEHINATSNEVFQYYSGPYGVSLDTTEPYRRNEHIVLRSQVSVAEVDLTP